MKYKLILLIPIILFMTGCWNYRELNQLAITTALAIDGGSDGTGYRVSLLIANGKNNQTNNREGQSQTVVYTGEGETISRAFKEINLQIPKNPYIGHLGVVVIGEDVAKETTQSNEESIILDAEIDNDSYMIIKKDGETILYKNNKKEKNVEFDKLPVMNFNMETAEASDKILSYSDADNKESTGGQVYRGKQIYAEKYLSFLKESGYEIKTYIKTNSYADVYLKKDDTVFRFIYIKKSEDSGAVIVGECKEKIPDSIDQIIEEVR